jgi:heptosyltransferase-1
VNPSSVLIIRLSAIGDVAMASGLIEALRARYPQARLVWLVQPEAKDLLAANPTLDDVIVWPRREWSTLWRRGRWWAWARAVRSFVRELRARRFDLAIDLQGLLKSGVWAWASGARERIGLGSKEGSGIFMTRVVERPRGDGIATEYVHLAHVLGAPAESFRMNIPVADRDAEQITLQLRERGIVGRYAVFCPFTTRPQKHWVEERWIELARRLPTETGLPVVLAGGPGDVEAAHRIASRTRIANLAGRTTLAQAAALIRNAALLIGVDTGLTHLGTAFRIPTIALFGATRPYLKTDSPKTQVLYHPLDCSPCYRDPTCGGAFHCMRHHSVDDVLVTARRLLV